MIRTLSFDTASAPRALHTAHDLMFAAMAGTLAWLAIARGLKPWWSAVGGGADKVRHLVSSVLRRQTLMQPTPSSSPAGSRMPRWERRGLAIACVIYLLVQANAALHECARGQDFEQHMAWMAKALADPWYYIKDYPRTCTNCTNPPLFHLGSALIYRLTGGVHFLEVQSLVTALLNLAALTLFYRVVLRRLIASRVMRLACLVFLLFVPFALIHAVVMASDALATPLFLTVASLFTLLAEARDARRFSALAVGIGLLLIAGLCTKFTFGSVVVASGPALAVLWRTGALDRRRLAVAAVCIVLLPGLFAALEFRYYFGPGHGFSHGISGPVAPPNTRMGYDRLLWVRRADTYLLSAPPYDDSPDGKTYTLLISNRFSYPALLWLASFTDSMDYYQQHPREDYFGHRSKAAQGRMRLAGMVGLPFFLLALIAVPVMFARGTYAALVTHDHRGRLAVLIVLLAGAFYINIVAFLPYVADAYYGGYWLPRLVVPALLCFYSLGFALLDEVLPQAWHSARWLCLLLVVAQAALHVSFLLPWWGPVTAVSTCPPPKFCR